MKRLKLNFFAVLSLHGAVDWPLRLHEALPLVDAEEWKVGLQAQELSVKAELLM